MHEYTKTLLFDFMRLPTASKLPSLIIALYESEGIDTLEDGRNPFKILRNVSAHAPNNIIDAFTDPVNIGSSRLMLKVSDDNEYRGIAADSLAVALIQTYLRTDDNHYIAFLHALYTKILFRDFCANNTVTFPDTFKYNGKLLDTTLKLYRHFKKLGVICPINESDEMFHKNVTEFEKVTWKIMVPDLNIFILYALQTKHKSKDLWQYIIDLYYVRRVNRNDA